jgi:hypothetical protein
VSECPSPNVNGMYPISLMYLTNYLKKSGFEGNIIDVSTTNAPAIEVIKYPERNMELIYQFGLNIYLLIQFNITYKNILWKRQ